MKRLAAAAALAAALAVLAPAAPALADVASALQTAGTNMIQWVRAGAIIVILVMGCLIVAGLRNIVAFGAAIVGLAIALQPEVIVGWIG